MLNAKVFALWIAWFISTVMMVAFTQNKVAAQETDNLLTLSDKTDSVLLAQTQEEELDAFFNSGEYTYCDAQMLGNYWGQSVVEAKARIGRKILWGNEGVPFLEQFFVDAQVEALYQYQPELCFFSESGYTYEDAVALADFWGEIDPWEAKIRIERNLILGNDRIVEEALRLATSR